MKCVVLVLSVLFASTLCGVLLPRRTKRFRSDYEYNEKTDAFYKLHIESRHLWDIRSVCESEGAALLMPVSQEDISQAHVLFKRYPDLGNFLFILSDGHVHDLEDEGVVNPIPYGLHKSEIMDGGGCEVLTRDGKIENCYYECFEAMPFICKVEAKDVLYDNQCDVYANNYKYIASVGSCYKISLRVSTWNEAYAECRRENAHLVILNSEAEKTVVQALMQDTPRVNGAQASEYFLAGFRAKKPLANGTPVYKTIFNETLQEAGFAVWSPGEPNDLYGNELCGTLNKNDGLLNDIFCDYKYAFICEKEVKIFT